MVDKEIIEDMLYTNPLLLLAIKDKQVIQELNNLIPYSTAFEIECDYGNNYNEDSFRAIPDIMSVSNDCSEQRYRIPNGLKGIICLYNISMQLKINSLLNPLSGIHYHVDCTDCFTELCPLIREEKNTELILSRLDTWLGEGETYSANSRYVGSWFKLNDLRTVEFRMGEMTFDYGLLLKRIIDCNDMVRGFKNQLEVPQPTFEEVDIPKVLSYVKANLPEEKTTLQKLTVTLAKIEKLNIGKVRPKEDTLDDIREIIKSRTHIL